MVGLGYKAKSYKAEKLSNGITYLKSNYAERQYAKQKSCVIVITIKTLIIPNN
jgi:hypothetical protein